MKTPLPDFKTERDNVLPALPKIVMLIPIAFYLTVLGSIGMGAWTFLQLKKMREDTAKHRQDESVEKGRIAALAKDEGKLSAEAKNGREVQNWINGSSEIYPFVSKIVRTVDAKTSLHELSMKRHKEMPSHLKMNVSLYSPEGAAQVEALSQAIAEQLHYRNYNDASTPKESDPNDIVFECDWAPETTLDETTTQ